MTCQILARLRHMAGLVINNKLVCGGRIPIEAEVMVWVADALIFTAYRLLV
jgi:hypothetical protein